MHAASSPRAPLGIEDPRQPRHPAARLLCTRGARTDLRITDPLRRSALMGVERDAVQPAPERPEHHRRRLRPLRARPLHRVPGSRTLHCERRLSLTFAALRFAGSLLLWRRHGAAGGDTLRTTPAGGHLMFANTLLFKTMMNILFVDVRSPGAEVSPGNRCPSLMRAQRLLPVRQKSTTPVRDSRCSGDIYVNGIASTG